MWSCFVLHHTCIAEGNDLDDLIDDNVEGEEEVGEQKEKKKKKRKRSELVWASK